MEICEKIYKLKIFFIKFYNMLGLKKKNLDIFVYLKKYMYL